MTRELYDRYFPFSRFPAGSLRKIGGPETALCSIALALFFAACVATAAEEPPVHYPKTVRCLETVVDLRVGETAGLVLSDGSKTTIHLVSVTSVCDPAVGALRLAKVMLTVNGKPLELESGNYRLPVTFENARIDVPVVGLYTAYSGGNSWGVAKDARIRVWPKDSPLAVPGTFVYPIRQRLFASSTQMNNEPVYVDGGERPGSKTQYYHYGLDFGGCEGEIEAVAAARSKIVSAGLEFMPDCNVDPVQPRYDVVYAVDQRGWYYRYSHLKRIDVKPGDEVRPGQRIGMLGKEASSGGWSHLHFGIVTAEEPGGLMGNKQAYPYVWEAYVNQYKPKIIAVARPHIVGVVGEPVELDGSRSWSASGKIKSFEWTLSNGAAAVGAKTKIVYDKPGYYSEVLKITDDQGNVEWDNTQVEIFSREMVADPPKDKFLLPASIHLAYAPTDGLKTGQEIVFKVRSFRTKTPGETIDFGDGSPVVPVVSDGNAQSLNPNGYAVARHSFASPGVYRVRAHHTDANGFKATCDVFVRVGQDNKQQDNKQQANKE